MSARLESGDLALFPYGGHHRTGDGDAQKQHLSLGIALVLHCGQQRLEAYSLSHIGDHWHLYAQLGNDAPRLLALAPCAGLPTGAEQAGLAILRLVWTIRLPSRLRLLQWRGHRQENAAMPADQRPSSLESKQDPCCFVSTLVAEGRSVRTLKGPMGTTEHLLLLDRPRAAI